jgi:hypothetical protein
MAGEKAVGGGPRDEGRVKKAEGGRLNLESRRQGLGE